jgi:hypothetical protein
MIDRDGDRYRWRLVRANSHGADVVARSVGSYDDERECYRSLGDFVDASDEATDIVRQPDGHCRWVVCRPDGAPLAESPGPFRDGAACAQALAELRRHAQLLVLSG